MQQISTLFKIEKPKALSERSELLSLFLEEINKERKGTKYQPVTPKFLAIKLSHIPTKDLYYLKSICLDSKNRTGSFSKCFFGSLKVTVKVIHTPQ